MRRLVWLGVLGALGVLGCGGGTATPAGSSNPSAGGGSGASAPPGRFVTSIVSYKFGSCAGFNQDLMPGVVEGPPVGAGTQSGSLNVLSLGGGGELVLGFDTAIVDGPGIDFIVFENPFWIGGNSNHIYDEPGKVSVSDDGVAWTSFSCNTPQSAPPPYDHCGGWHVVYSNPTNGIDPLDPSVAGGDQYDLATIGVQHARYVMIQDQTSEGCDPKNTPGTNGFDLDAIGIVNAAD